MLSSGPAVFGPRSKASVPKTYENRLTEWPAVPLGGAFWLGNLTCAHEMTPIQAELLLEALQMRALQAYIPQASP
jgi:hypothetical protein